MTDTYDPQEEAFGDAAMDLAVALSELRQSQMVAGSKGTTSKVYRAEAIREIEDLEERIPELLEMLADAYDAL